MKQKVLLLLILVLFCSCKSSPEKVEISESDKINYILGSGKMIMDLDNNNVTNIDSFMELKYLGKDIKGTDKSISKLFQVNNFDSIETSVSGNSVGELTFNDNKIVMNSSSTVASITSGLLDNKSTKESKSVLYDYSYNGDKIEGSRFQETENYTQGDTSGTRIKSTVIDYKLKDKILKGKISYKYGSFLGVLSQWVYDLKFGEVVISGVITVTTSKVKLSALYNTKKGKLKESSKITMSYDFNIGNKKVNGQAITSMKGGYPYAESTSDYQIFADNLTDEELAVFLIYILGPIS